MGVITVEGQQFKIAGDKPTRKEAERILAHFEQQSRRLTALDVDRQKNQMALDESAGGGLNRFLIGAGRGLKNVGEGLRQVAGEVVGEDQAQRNAEVEKERALYQQYRPSGGAVTAGEFVGENLPALAVPGGPAGTGLKALAGRVAAEAGIGAGIGAAQFTGEGDSRMKNALTGAAFGGATSGTLGAVGAGFRGLRNAGDAAADSVNRMRETGVREMAGEAFDSPFLKFLQQNVTDRLPMIGTQGERVAQLGEAAARAENVRKRMLGLYTKETSGLVDDVADSLERVAEQNNQFVKGIYRQVDRLDDGTPLTAENTKNAIARAIRQADEFKPLNDETKALLQKAADLDGENFRKVVGFRSQVLDEIRNLKRSPDRDTSAIKALTAVEQGIERDINAWAKSKGGRIEKLWRRANKEYVERVKPFKDNDIRKILEGESDIGVIIQKYIKRTGAFADRSKKASQLTDRLDPRGRNAVKMAILDEAFRKAIPEDGQFLPGQFASVLKAYRGTKRMPGASTAVFSKRELQELDGLTALMENIKGASGFRSNPWNGSRLFEPLLLGGTYFAFDGGTALMGAGGLYTLGLLLTTRKGRSALAALAKRRDDPAMVVPVQNALREIVEQINKTAPRVAATQSTGDE